MHSPRITLLSGDNPPSSCTKCLLHALSPQQFPLLLQTGKRRNRTKPGQEPTGRQLEAALNSVLTPTISERQNFVDQMLRMLIRQKVRKLSDLTPCFVTLPLAPSRSSNTLFFIFTQPFSFSQSSTNEHISVAASAEESLITQRNVFGSLWECSTQQMVPKSHCWAKQAF